MAAIALPFAIFLIAHAAVYAVYLGRQKVLDDAIRDLWQQLAALWSRNPEVFGIISSGTPLQPEDLAARSLQTRADVSTAMGLCDALGALASRFGVDRTMLFSVWPASKMWRSLNLIVLDERTRNPVAFTEFQKAVDIEERFSNRLIAAARGQSNVFMVTLAVGIAVLIFAVDQTIVASALPTIAAQLSGVSLYGWVFSAYTIAATATTLLYGRLADLTSRRTLFVIAMTGFLMGSILCGMAPNMTLLVAFRALQGLFGGATFPLAIAIIADTYPIEKRAQGFAIVPITFGFAAIIGPLLGGFLTESVGWRAIFFVNIPIVLTAIILLTASYHAPSRHGRLSIWDIDPPGILTLFGGLVTLLIALTVGGHEYDWASWEEVLLLVAGAVLLLSFFWVETKVRRPLLPLRVFKHPGLRGALLTIALLAWVFYSMIIFMPEFVEAGLNADAQAAGLVLIPMMLAWSLTANFAVRMGQRAGFRNVALCGVPFIIGGLIYTYFMRYGFQSWTVAPGLAMIGLGAGMINPNMLVMAQNSLSDQDQGLAGGLGNVSMSLSGAIAAAGLSAFQVGRLEIRAHLSSVMNSSDLLTPFGRFQMSNVLGNVWVGALQRWMTASIHDVFVVAFIPAVALGVWLGFFVVPSNARLQEIRLPPLRKAPPPPEESTTQPVASPVTAPEALPDPVVEGHAGA